MSLISSILPFRSLSIVGMAKNTGKTVCLNYVLEQLRKTDKVLAVTSIGIDGEQKDQVTQTEKPEVTLYEGSFFVTTEYFYRQRRLVSEIYDILEETTSMGRLVIAKVLQTGKAIIAGPASSVRMKALINRMDELGVDMTIVDGALSRRSPAAPSITDGLILSTGAAIAPDIPTIVDKTRFVYRMTQLPEYETSHREELIRADSGIYALENDTVFQLPIASPLLFAKSKDVLFQHGSTLFISGILTDAILEYLKTQPEIKKTALIVKDFTKIFVTPFILNSYLQKGGSLFVLQKPNLTAICVNPTSPMGARLNSHDLQNALQKVVEVPVYDIKMLES
ncbi:MAG: hypothetical protein J6T59_00010 [Bacteroidales bacterium]|nr:hypothetical protein [Bacteroidales bacterium]